MYVRFTKSAKQLTGFHFLISFLKQFRGTNSLIFVGVRSQILDLKNEAISVPLQTEFTKGRYVDFSNYICLLRKF